MAKARTVRLDQFPIPHDAQADPRWPPLMLDIAAHIGPYATLLIVDAFGGQDVYVPIDGSTNKFRELIGPERADIMSHVYGRENLAIPLGTSQLHKARRAGIVAACREGRMTISDGAAMIPMRRGHLSRLVNHSDEGKNTAPMVLTARTHDPRQLDMFATSED